MISYFADPALTELMLYFEHRRAIGDPVRVYLAEGDSWFSIGGLTSNLLQALDGHDTLIVSCAMPGDTIRKMSALGNEPFALLLEPEHGTDWDAVLLSAGGNDLLADIGCMISQGNLDNDLVDSVLDGIELGYQAMVGTVRRHHDCPIHCHTYDYPVSDPRGGWFRLGPWIGDKLTACGIPENRHDQIITDLIDALAERLRRVADLTVHDTRGTLDPGTWSKWRSQKHWRNEIHPSFDGYRRLAAHWQLGTERLQ